MQQTPFKINFLGERITCYYIKEKSDAYEALQQLKNCNDLIGIDTETEALPEWHHVEKAALSPHLSRIRLIQVFTGKTAIVFDLKFIDCDEMFINFLESKKFVAHNALFDLMFFKRIGVKQMDIACTYILFKMLTHATRPTDEGIKASLGALSHGILKAPILKEVQASDWSVPDLTFEQVEYAAIDAISVRMLAERMAPSISRNKLQRYWNLCKRAQHPIADMQLNGITLDVEKHREMVIQWREDLYTAKKELIKLTGLDRITAHSISDFLKSKLPNELLQIWPRTDTGKLKTDANTLNDFAGTSSIVEPFSEFQKKTKLATSFGMSLIHQINPATGRIHAGYRICGTRTGRLSCSNPNLQQAPHDEAFRKNFIPAPGYSFVLADYSSVEVRIAAEVSQDSRMLQVFSEGTDIYKYTAAALNGRAIDSITKDERTGSKALVLGLQFGLSHKKFGQYARKNYGIEIDDDEAGERVKAYRKLYPEFRRWQMETVKEAAMNNFTSRTPFGKLRKYDPEAAYGNVLNHPIQGGAAEAMLCGMIHTYNNLPDGCKMIASVHDEIILECPYEQVEEAKEVLERCMTEGYLNVFPSGKTIKNLVEANGGKSWAEAKG